MTTTASNVGLAVKNMKLRLRVIKGGLLQRPSVRYGATDLIGQEVLVCTRRGCGCHFVGDSCPSNRHE